MKKYDKNRLFEVMSIVDNNFKILNEELRSVKVTYDNGDEITTNMAAHLTDEDINNYFKIGKSLNIGSSGNDLISKVKKVEILK